jgi:hypothetical protein
MYKKYWWYPNEKESYLFDWNQINMIKKVLNKNSKILDIWCWKWYLSKIFTNKNGLYYLWLDISVEAINLAKKNNPKWNFISIDFKDFNEYSNFDVVIDNWLFHILENINDYFDILNKISQWTYFCIRVFDWLENHSKLYNINCWDFTLSVYWYKKIFIIKNFLLKWFKLIYIKKWVKYDNKNSISYYLFLKNKAID